MNSNIAYSFLSYNSVLHFIVLFIQFPACEYVVVGLGQVVGRSHVR